MKKRLQQIGAIVERFSQGDDDVRLMSCNPPAIHRPLKRTRTEADGSGAPLSRSPPRSSSPAPFRIKNERSPSPLLSERRLITSGTRRFTPIPHECLPSCTGYKQYRLDWAARCVGELEALSLIPERKLFRDDGLVIDWRSHVPVWSDTLKPDPQDLAATIMLTYRSNAQRHLHSVLEEPLPNPAFTVSTHEHPAFAPVISDVELPSKKRLPVPPRPSSKHRNDPSRMIPAPPNGLGSSSVCSEGPRASTETDGESRFRSRDGPSNSSDRVSDILSEDGQFGVSLGHSCDAGNQPLTLDAPSAAEEEMSDMTLDYLRRYVQTYESDRASLASAYACNASFGYRSHRTLQNINGAPSSPQCFSSGSKRTRLDIVTTLLTLPSLHSNAQRSGIAQIEYDIFYLGAKLGMFVVCRMVDSTKTVIHNLILQRKEVDMEDAAIEGVWPVTAVAHQILVFPT